jgi:hypothetical protein
MAKNNDIESRIENLEKGQRLVLDALGELLGRRRPRRQQDPISEMMEAAGYSTPAASNTFSGIEEHREPPRHYRVQSSGSGFVNAGPGYYDYRDIIRDIIL